MTIFLVRTSCYLPIPLSCYSYFVCQISNTEQLISHNFTFITDQLHSIGYKLVMLGDETWIKLFPTLFYRQDGVSSFYVSLVSCITCFSCNELGLDINCWRTRTQFTGLNTDKFGFSFHHHLKH
jgi:hypothetical protein